MWNVILEILSVIAILGLIFYLILWVRKRITTPTYQGKSGKPASTYFINFKENDKPDIRQNSKLMDILSIKYETSDGFVVASTINDIKLRQLIMREYQLKLKNVIVTYRQLV
ncbi:hypothetical protein ACFSN5_09430 [Streptococcus tangpeifui]